jgi:hypothetical protein
MSLSLLQSKVDQYNNSKDDEVNRLVEHCILYLPVLSKNDKEVWMTTIMSQIEEEAKCGKTLYGIDLGNKYGTKTYKGASYTSTRHRERKVYNYYNHFMCGSGLRGYSSPYITLDHDLLNLMDNNVFKIYEKHWYDYESSSYPSGLGFWRIDVQDKIKKITCGWSIIKTSCSDVKKRVVKRLKVLIKEVSEATFRSLADYWVEHSDIPMEQNGSYFTFNWKTPQEEDDYQVQKAREDVKKYQQKLDNATQRLQKAKERQTELRKQRLDKNRLF